MRLAIVVIAFEAERYIQSVLHRIPETVAGERPIVLVSDDASRDSTFDRAREWADQHRHLAVDIIRQQRNIGYGGNQAFSFEWAAANGADVVVLLHGDGQYPPEMVGDLIVPILEGVADAVFGSRMRVAGAARRGGMPLTRRVGNRALTVALNRLTMAHFSEWFSGFRAYSIPALESISMDALPTGFDFDVAMTLELLGLGWRVAEIPIPTHYGDELSRVPLMRTGLAVIAHGMRAGLSRRRRAGRVGGG